MRVPSARELLDVWDRGRGRSPSRRALALLAAALPDRAADALRDLGIGDRDRALLALHESLFGPALEAMADCPSCGEPSEMTLEARPLREGRELARGSETLRFDGYEVRWRLPNCGDLLDLEGEAGAVADVDSAIARLVRRVVVEADRDGRAMEADDLPGPVLEKVRVEVERLGGESAIDLDLTCPACEHRWLAGLDVPAFVARELDGLARSLLGQVHRLATAYGWDEDVILSMSSRRRDAYLELIGA